MKLYRWTIFFAVIFFVTNHAFSAVEKNKNQVTLEKIKKNKILKVCSEAGYIPLEMKSASGDWLGFDVEMMKAYAESLSVDLQMMDTKWDGIIPSLISKKCDLIASSMAKTPVREKVVAFSDSYFRNQFLIAVKDTKENGKKYKTISDFNSKSIKVAVKTGSSPDLYLQESKILSQATILRYDADADTISAVLNGKVDGFIYDTPYVKLAAINYPGKLYIIPEGFGGDDFGVAFRKEDSDLLKNFNHFLSQWKKDGGYNKMFKYYFEGTQWRSPLDK
jgi:polar amino acid transport system substrate-binding protein